MSEVLKRTWRTENWLRFGTEIFMVQQKWELHGKAAHTSSYGYTTMQPFPTNQWRIKNLKDVITDDDLRELLEARDAA